MTISIGVRNWTNRGDTYFEFWSSKAPNGNYARGDWETHGETAEQNMERAIVATMTYLNIPRWEISGQEHTKPVTVTAPSRLEIMQKAQEEVDRQKVVNAAQQLLLKSEMLSSPNAVWSSKEIYNTALAETNTAIRLFNETPQGSKEIYNTALAETNTAIRLFNETPQGAGTGTGTGTATEAPGTTISSSLLSVLAIPLIILLILFFVIFKR